MFPKNSAFHKSEETAEYEEGVRQHALNSVSPHTRNQIEELIKEAKALVDSLREAVADNDEDRGKTSPPRQRPRRPY